MKISILFLLFSLSLCQNIITSWHYDKVAMYDIQKINTFLVNEFTTEKPFNIPNIISFNNILIKNISLVGVKASLYDSFLNYNNGLFLLTPNKVTLNFNFSYSESTRGYNDTAILELKIDVIKIKIWNDKVTQRPKISIRISSPKENYNVPGINDKEFLKLLMDTLFTGFQMQSILSRTVSERFSSGILDYYKKFYSKRRDFKIQTTKFFGNFIFPMNINKFLYFCEDLIGDYKNTFCYYQGYNDLHELIKDKTKIPLSNERFSHNNDNLFNIFINKDLMCGIINYITESYFQFNSKIYNNQTNIKQLSYDFNVASLKKYFNGLDYLKNEDSFYCEVFIDTITLNEVIYRVKFIIGGTNFMIKINSTLNVDVIRIKNLRFNLCLKEAKTTNVEVIESSNINIIDLDGLKKVIDESFDYDYNKICFTDEGISMRDYFTKIKDIYMRDEGLYLEGNHLYQ